MVKNVLETLVSESVVVTVIIANTVLIFVMGFEAHAGSAGLVQLDKACVLYFVLELVIKLGFLGWRGYWKRGWNRFDFLVVMASSPCLVFPEAGGLIVVSVFRTARLLRFFRLLQFIPNSDHLWAGVLRALRASVGVLLAATFYNFFLCLVAFFLFSQIAPPGEASIYFADPLMSLYSIFQTFTVEGWYEIPGYLAANSTPAMGTFVRVFFAFTVVTGGLLGVSLANAVFVDQMVMDNTEPLEQHLEDFREEMRRSHNEIADRLAELSRRLDQLRGGEVS